MSGVSEVNDDGSEVSAASVTSAVSAIGAVNAVFIKHAVIVSQMRQALAQGVSDPQALPSSPFPVS